MPPRRQPTARQARLGTELRKLREAAGLKATEAADLLGVNSVQMSQIESGIAGVSEERVRRLASHYSCSDEELIAALANMATDRTKGWWDAYRGLIPTSFLDLSELDHNATRLREVAVLYVPGLLQTETYARAVFSSKVPELTAEEVDLRVRHRMERKKVIERHSPLPYEAVVHEAALRIRVHDRASARAQLAQILHLTEAEHITVRVIPFDLDGFSRASSAMTYASGPVPKLDTVVLDVPHRAAFIDAEAQLAAFRTRFRMVEGVSLTPDRSQDFIHRLTKEL